VVSALSSISVVNRVTTWMGDCLQAGKLSGYVTSHLRRLSLASLRGRRIEYQPVWLLGLRRGVFTWVRWQVTLCDPTWQVTLRSCEMGFCYLYLYLYLYCMTERVYRPSV